MHTRVFASVSLVVQHDRVERRQDQSASAVASKGVVYEQER